MYLQGTSTGHAMCFMTQYVFMTETKQLRISQKHSMRAIFMQIWQLEVIFWFMTEKCVHYLKVMKTYFHAVVISTSSDRNRPILQPAGASDERLWVLVCALGPTQGLQVHAAPSKLCFHQMIHDIIEFLLIKKTWLPNPKPIEKCPKMLRGR